MLHDAELHYLDNAATTIVAPEVAEAIQNAGVNMVRVRVDDEEFNVIGNNFAFIYF